MTLGEAHGVTNRMRFRGGLSALRASVGISLRDSSATLRVQIRVPDRDALNFKTMPIARSYAMSPECFAMLSEDEFVRIIIEQFKALMQHETLEGIWLDDKIVIDPHRPEARAT